MTMADAMEKGCLDFMMDLAGDDPLALVDVAKCIIETAHEMHDHEAHGKVFLSDMPEHRLPRFQVYTERDGPKGALNVRMENMALLTALRGDHCYCAIHVPARKMALFDSLPAGASVVHEVRGGGAGGFRDMITLTKGVPDRFKIVIVPRPLTHAEVREVGALRYLDIHGHPLDILLNNRHIEVNGTL
jgi:hypothetical protein